MRVKDFQVAKSPQNTGYTLYMNKKIYVYIYIHISEEGPKEPVIRNDLQLLLCKSYVAGLRCAVETSRLCGMWPQLD